jgi:hypothetical protein
MLIRALKLRTALSKYHDRHEAEYLRLSSIEWSQVEYLIDLIKIFCLFIKMIEQIRHFTLHQIFEIYDKLFDHLDRARTKLLLKKLSWKRELLKSLTAADDKLRKHYVRIQDTLSYLYDKIALLSSIKKDTIFQNSNWKVSNDEISWLKIYWDSLNDHFNDEYANNQIS